MRNLTSTLIATIAPLVFACSSKTTDESPLHNFAKHQDAGQYAQPDAETETPSPDAATAAHATEAVDAFCKADCGRSQRCESTPDPMCDTACADRAIDWAPKYLLHVTECLGEIGCDKDDTCYEAGVLELFPNFMADPTIADCGAKADICAFHKDLCATMAVLNENARVEADACVSKPCNEDIGGCLKRAGAFKP